MQTITAKRTGKDTYDVTENGNTLKDLPYAYLLSCAKAGIIVEVDQRNFHDDNELPMYRMEQNN